MANGKTRNLDYKVKVDTDQAERDLKRLASVEGAGGATTGSGDRSARNLAQSLDRAAKSAKSFDDGAKNASASMSRLVRGFGGMAVGLAASYAATHMENGAAKTGVEYGASAIQGASAGFALGGPIGAAAGGVIGLLKTYLDKRGEIRTASKEFERGEYVHQNTREWQLRFEGLNDVRKQGGIANTLDALNKELEHFKEVVAKNAEDVRSKIKSGDMDGAALDREALQANRGRQEQIEDAIRSLERQRDEAARPRESFAALDSLSRIGASFGGGDLGRDQLNVQREMAQTLRSIDQKTKTGGSTWQ